MSFLEWLLSDAFGNMICGILRLMVDISRCFGLRTAEACGEILGFQENGVPDFGEFEVIYIFIHTARQTDRQTDRHTSVHLVHDHDQETSSCLVGIHTDDIDIFEGSVLGSILRSQNFWKLPCAGCNIPAGRGPEAGDCF